MAAEVENFKLMQTFLSLSELRSPSSNSETLLRAPSDQTLASSSLPNPKKSHPELRTISTTNKSDQSSDYLKKEFLGQGGMGLVYKAEQISLKRDVAIKEIHRGTKEVILSNRLINEARLVGKLEHPNVAPIYELGQTHDGFPMLIMKRVDGISWNELLRDPEHEFWSKVPGDRLVWNIGVLIQICNAVDYAHAQGIIHRDIKPENIMLGHYGEIYLLDWGLAFNINDNDDDRAFVPTAAGTPAYMAPEMLRSLEDIDYRTDVYLLGAILYELLTGVAPHKGDSAPEAIKNILEDREPSLPENLPEDIKQICRKTISFEKEDRFESAAQLRNKLQEHLAQRTSNQLVNECKRKSRELQELLLEIKKDPNSTLLYERCAGIYMEALVSARLALTQWPENEKAKRTQTSLNATMIRIELERKALDRAEALLSCLDEIPQDIERKTQELVTTLQEEEKRRQELEQFAAEQDKTVGARARSGMFKIFIVMATILQTIFIVRAQIQANKITTEDLFYSFLTILIVAAFVIYRLRKSLWANERSKQIANSILGIIALIFFIRLEAFLINSPPLLSARNELFMGIGFFTVYAITLFRYAWWLVGQGVLCYVLLYAFPSQIELIFGTYLLGITVLNYFILSQEIPKSQKN